MRHPVRAYIGIGSNCGDSRRHLERAIAQLAALPQAHRIERARFYRTTPQSVSLRQPLYYNTVVALDTTLSVDALFAALRRIEREHRRTRPYPKAPRTLDLDLLLYGEQIRRSRRVTLPHPRLHQRPFALVPLLDLANVTIPGVGRASKALRRCALVRGSGIRVVGGEQLSRTGLQAGVSAYRPEGRGFKPESVLR